VQYGREEDEWSKLVSTGKKFLVERAELRRTTSYTEFNAALVNRTATSGFNFDLDVDRAAVGRLLEQVSEEAYTETGGLLISALVQYLGANDAGPGFYSLAKTKGFKVPTSAGDRQLFWANHVSEVHAHYARPHRRLN